jgi:hypothetical protein
MNLKPAVDFVRLEGSGFLRQFYLVHALVFFCANPNAELAAVSRVHDGKQLSVRTADGV